VYAVFLALLGALVRGSPKGSSAGYTRCWFLHCFESQDALLAPCTPSLPGALTLLKSLYSFRPRAIRHPVGMKEAVVPTFPLPLSLFRISSTTLSWSLLRRAAGVCLLHRVHLLACLTGRPSSQTATPPSPTVAPTRVPTVHSLPHSAPCLNPEHTRKGALQPIAVPEDAAI